MAFGLDYVSGPSVTDLRAADVTFVCRYLSYVNSLTQVKLLTPNEAQALSSAGIAIVSNYEWYANRALEGFASGVQDAQIAAAQHASCGGPSDRPIYFSVDVDVDGSQVADYFKGVASVIGKNRTGAYGSYRVLQYLFNAGLIVWGWQTYAWSYGAWEQRAHIQQYSNGMVLSGHSVDYNRSIKSDFGQWRIGGGTTTMTVPANWHDDGTTLVSPSSTQGGPAVPITGLFRAYILANNWPASNVALAPAYHTSPYLEASNTSLGAGQQLIFRYAMLEIPDSGPNAGKVIFAWLGVELAHVRSQFTAAQAKIAELEQELAAATKPTGLDATVVADRLQAIGLAANNGNAAIQQLVTQPF